MKLKLPDSVSSPQDLKALVLDIRQYARWFNQTAVKMRVPSSNSYQPPSVSEAAAELINDWAAAKPLDQKSLDELITSLEELQDKLPRITITLAAPAPNDLKKDLIAWCRQNLEPNILVELRFNATLLGGMVVRFGSHVYDWSFRRQILAGRDKFPEALRRV